MRKQNYKLIGEIRGVSVGPVYAIRDGQKVPVQDRYNPGPKKGARWDDPCEPYNRGREVSRCDG
jgi:hypothetical protein